MKAILKENLCSEFMLDILLILLMIVSGFFFGIIAIMVGVGGGLLNVPFLIYVMEVDPLQATLISSFIIIFSSSSGFLKYRSENRIDMRTAGIFLVFAIPGTILGGWVATLMDAAMIKQSFAVLVGLASIRGIQKAWTMKNNDNDGEEIIPEKEYRKIVATDGQVYEYNAKIAPGRFFAFLGGFVAGLLGIGGGLVYVPLLTSIVGIPIHVAVATSTTMIIIVSIMAVFTKGAALSAIGLFDLSLLLTYGLPIAFGSVFGARLGAGRVKKINAKWLLIFFWTIAFFSAMRMLIG